MNIGIVLYPTFGGSGVVATELGRALARKGHHIHFISYAQPVRMELFEENIFYHEVNVPAYPLFEFSPYEVALTSKIVDVALHEKLDVIHAHYAIPHASAAYFAKMILQGKGMHVPIVTTLHGTDITLVGKDKSYEPVITFAINQSDAVTTVSDSLRRDTYKYFQIDREIQVIYNFIDYAYYQNPPDDCLKRYTAPNGEKIIMHISNFRKVKRIPDVVRAFHLIRREVPSKLVLVGDGPERPNIETLVRELGLQDDVVFLGKVKSSHSVLPCSDLFMLPSESESFGLSALEALACGVPVISTNAGGVPEVQIHGATGYLSEIGDYEDMAKNAIGLLKDEEKLSRFRKNAREKAREFDLPNILPQYEQLYLKVIDKKSVTA